MYYHGTKAEFTEFSKKGSGKHGPGFYFTKSKNEAYSFAHNLAGDGSDACPKIYTVELSFNNLFDTMSVPMCQEVCQRLGTTYKIPEFAGGLKEHYYHLQKQLKRKGLSENLNDTLKDLGFDGLFYEFMEHYILFSPEQIRLVSVENC